MSKAREMYELPAEEFQSIDATSVLWGKRVIPKEAVVHILDELIEEKNMDDISRYNGSYTFLTKENECLRIHLNENDLRSNDPDGFKQQLQDLKIKQQVQSRLPIRRLALQLSAGVLAALTIAGVSYALSKSGTDRDMEGVDPGEFMSMVQERDRQEALESWYKEEQRKEAEWERQQVQGVYDTQENKPNTR